MDAIEKAIRSALEKGNARNAAYRERVYKSAFAALERALNARDTISDDLAERRRTGLRAKILEIETEFAPATDVERDDAPIHAAKPPPVESDGEATAVAPDVEVDRVRPDAPGPDAAGHQSEFGGFSPRRRPYATMFMVVLLLAAAGTGVWWTIQSGILLPADERSGKVPNPPPKLDGESFRPEKLPDDLDDQTDSDIPRNWIGIFETANSTDVTAPSGATAELVERDGENYLRVSSQGGVELLFDVGEGTLERIAGGKALFSISARAQEGQTTQISVACDLAELGDCGRKRFEINATLSEFLFEVELPGSTPGAAGTIAINPDISNGGQQLDIKEIRVAITR